MRLLERAAKSPDCLDNAKLAAFKPGPDRSGESTRLVCEAGESAERYFSALTGGNGYALTHSGQSAHQSGEMRQQVDSYDIHHEGSGERIGEAETYRDPSGKLLIIAFEIKAGELIPLSMIARAMP